MGLVRLSDTIYTFRFLKLLSTKWEDTDAYKLGIIDKNGTPLKKSKDLKTKEEKNAYTVFVRLVFKFKRLMGMVPGGKSAVARYGAAVALLKEHREEIEMKDISVLVEKLKMMLDIDEEVLDEEVTNSVDGIAGKDQPFSDRKVMRRKEMKRRRLKKNKKSCPFRNSTNENTNKNTNDEIEENDIEYTYQIIDGHLIRVPSEILSERKRVYKKRVIDGKRVKRREYVSGKNSRYTRTGNRKLRGSALTKRRRALKKAVRKAHTGSAKRRRARSLKKSRKYNHIRSKRK